MCYFLNNISYLILIVIQIEEFKMRRRISIETLVDKIIEGKRRKGRAVIPDRNAVIQDELAKITAVPYERIRIDFSKHPYPYLILSS